MTSLNFEFLAVNMALPRRALGASRLLIGKRRGLAPLV